MRGQRRGKALRADSFNRARLPSGRPKFDGIGRNQNSATKFTTARRRFVNANALPGVTQCSRDQRRNVCFTNTRSGSRDEQSRRHATQLQSEKIYHGGTEDTEKIVKRAS